MTTENSPLLLNIVPSTTDRSTAKGKVTKVIPVLN
jgi:hypothetical protein